MGVYIYTFIVGILQYPPVCHSRTTSRRSQNLGQDNILRPMQTRMSKQFKTPVSDNRNTRGGPDNRIGCDECLVPISRHLGQSGRRRPA